MLLLVNYIKYKFYIVDGMENHENRAKKRYPYIEKSNRNRPNGHIFIFAISI